MKRPLFLYIGALALVALGCGMSGGGAAADPLAGPVYWAAETATPQPTVTRFLGTTTPVYAATPPPIWLTGTPFLTTVTATPLAPPPTATPAGFTATPFWVTTTPFWVTSTPPPAATTTPGLPQIGFTTPAPTETPYYRVGSFYMHSDVYVGGPDGLVVRLVGHETAPSPRQAGAVYHYVTARLTNRGAAPRAVALADFLFFRRVDDDRGRWTAQTEPLRARGLPGYEGQATPLMPGETREQLVGFVLPAGVPLELGLITEWQRPLEGGVPVWFFLAPDPLGPFVDADGPPPPTPRVIGDGGWVGDGGGTTGSGDGRWPTTGVITRGFGCHTFYTGVDGAGFGCPPGRPWFHNGVDVAAPAGTVVRSPVDGAVSYAGPDATGADCSDMAGSRPPHRGLGNYVRLGDGTTRHYLGHLQGFLAGPGPVAAGQPVGEMGSSGCSTGTHLHWIVYVNGELVDPAAWAGPGPAP